MTQMYEPDAAPDGDSGETVGSPRRSLLLRAGALVAAIGVLAAGALLLGRTPEPEIGDASAYIRDFYQRRDAEGLVAAIPPGSLTPAQQANAVQDFSTILDRPVSVEVAQPFDIEGAPVVRVVTSDGVEWCVNRQDGAVLPRCRLGTMPVTLDVGDNPLETVVAVANVYPAESRIGLAVTPTGERVDFAGRIRLEDAGEVVPTVGDVSAAINEGEGLLPVPNVDVELEPDGNLLLLWVGDTDQIESGMFQIVWDSGTMEIEIGEVDWLL